MLAVLLAMTDSPEEKRKITLLYEKYHKLMHVHAFQLIGNQHDAEDIELSAWEKIIKNIHYFENVDCNETKNLIMLIVESVIKDFFKSNNRIRNAEQSYENLEEISAVAVKDENLEIVEICEMLNTMPKKYRDVLILYYVNDLSTVDIAELLGVSENTVWQRLYRGRQMLKEMKFYGVRG